MLKKHLKDTNSSLVICANIEPNVATFKLYNTKEEDSLKLCYTISNMGDLKTFVIEKSIYTFLNNKGLSLYHLKQGGVI